MSKSAKEVLLDYQKKVKHISKDINFLIKFIEKIISECKEIDNSEIYHEELNRLINELKNKENDLNENAFEKIISKDVHTATETLKEINAYLNRQINEVALIKAAALDLKQQVLNGELTRMKTAFQETTFSNYQNQVSEFLNQLKDADQIAFAQEYIKTNEQILRNLNSKEFGDKIIEKIEKHESEAATRFNRVVQSQLQQYENDQDLINLIKEVAESQKSSLGNGDIEAKITDFLSKSEFAVASEVVRKEVITKIIKGIRAVGFHVNKEDVTKINDGKKVMIFAQKPTGETAQFAVDLDGSYIYNFEGYEGREHDYDTDNFIQKLRDFGLATSDEFETVYRQPKFVAKSAIPDIKLKNSKKIK
ncbi:hypothetical protein SSABA_v1c07200 [Spiroplasma sabaudiense Ar-1343]|uniref:Uncharacterized protein n=1 Tax=Spiroplasma sabaudiense Ar-1343 TaxID=1276257 RepID=W6AAN6_9MOLU|nr:hypothetical protein [Spiroplasma sabaudiense]AHI54122.1 hypothetical protein SSABA_v1c07200 [Spiroplasma sabaudiense Ar-1343]